MKQFKEGQIVKAIQDAPYVAIGEIAEVKIYQGYPELALVFYEGVTETAFPCKHASSEHFDFYEKIA